MRLLVFRVYPGPGVVADRQLGQDHRKPGDRIVFADPAAWATRSTARRWARRVARSMESAAGPLTGASVRARASRSGKAAIPATIIAAAAGWVPTSNGTPSAGPGAARRPAGRRRG